MTSFNFAGIPSELLSRLPHREISHCLESKQNSKVLNLGDNKWLPDSDETYIMGEKFDLAVVNLGSAPPIGESLDRVVNDLNLNGYFGLIFLHWPGMRKWFVYELRDDLLERDQEIWEKSCKALDDFLSEGAIQVVEREVLNLPPNFLEGVDLMKLFEQHWSTFDFSFDSLLRQEVGDVLRNIESFLETSNSNLDLCVESIFGVREW